MAPCSGWCQRVLILLTVLMVSLWAGQHPTTSLSMNYTSPKMENTPAKPLMGVIPVQHQLFFGLEVGCNTCVPTPSMQWVPTLFSPHTIPLQLFSWPTALLYHENTRLFQKIEWEPIMTVFAQSSSISHWAVLSLFQTLWI